MSDSETFKRLLSESGLPELTSERIERVVKFREEVLNENALQNLTRLTEPKDFFEGHVLDVVHLERSKFVSFPALDIGAGMGVPGLLHAVLFAPSGVKTWLSSDSEGKKADFGQRMIELFDLKGCSSSSRRGEEILDDENVESIVARAVGPVSRIYGWFRTRSTWNNLVLLKGPKWDDEWKEFESSPLKGRLILDSTYEYAIGTEGKRLKIVRLRRR